MNVKEIHSIKNQNALILEAYRILRTNLQFASVSQALKVILVTSSKMGEGKSTTAANLAAILAESGKKSVLIDCDQRKPQVHKNFSISNEKGLSNFLIGEYKLDEILQETDQENLYIVTSGQKSPNSTELLASLKMKNFIEILKDYFDYIILDTPPVMMVADTQIVSQYADGCLLVIASGETSWKNVVKAKDALKNARCRIIGVVLNKINSKTHEYGQYYEVEEVKRKEKKNFFRRFRRKKAQMNGI